MGSYRHAFADFLLSGALGIFYELAFGVAVGLLLHFAFQIGLRIRHFLELLFFRMEALFDHFNFGLTDLSLQLAFGAGYFFGLEIQLLTVAADRLLHFFNSAHQAFITTAQAVARIVSTTTAALRSAGSTGTFGFDIFERLVYAVPHFVAVIAGKFEALEFLLQFLQLIKKRLNAQPFGSAGFYVFDELLEAL